MSDIKYPTHEISTFESLYPKNETPKIQLPYQQYGQQTQLPYLTGGISADTFMFASAIRNMNSAAQSISQISVEWISQGEESKVFDDYIQKLKQLELIFQKYGELAKKDTQSIKSIGETIESVDSNSMLLW